MNDRPPAAQAGSVPDMAIGHRHCVLRFTSRITARTLRSAIKHRHSTTKNEKISYVPEAVRKLWRRQSRGKRKESAVGMSCGLSEKKIRFMLGVKERGSYGW